MVLLDASVLIAYFHPATAEDDKLRIQSLLEQLQKKRTEVIVPTPALCELLAKADDAATRYEELLASSKAIRVASFGTKASIECAEMLKDFKTKGDKRNEGKSWAKAKFDWQIMAIAKAEGVTRVVSADGDIKRLGKQMRIAVDDIAGLPIPEAKRQRPLALPKS